MSGEAWTSARDETLRALAESGMSYAAIAERMHTTKNSIVGRAHRLHLPARPSPILRDRSPKPKMVKAPKVTLPVVKAVGVERKPQPVTTTRQRPVSPFRECQFPMGKTGRVTRFCEAATQPGSSYCMKHHKICHAPNGNAQ